MKYIAMLHYGLFRATVDTIHDCTIVTMHSPTVLHAKFSSEKEAVTWAEGLSNLPFVRGVVLSGKRGRRSYDKVYVVAKRFA